MSDERPATHEEALASARADGHNLRLVSEDDEEDEGASSPTQDAPSQLPEIRRKMWEMLAEKVGFPFDVPDHEWEDKGFCLRAIGRSKASLRFVPAPFWKDKDFCLEAIRLSLSEKALRLVHRPLWGDADFCLRAIRLSEPGVSRDGWDGLDEIAMHLTHDRLWRDGDFCMAAVRQSWKMLGRIDKEAITPQMCEAALAQAPHALGYVPQKMQTEKLIFDAIRADGMAIEHVSKWLLTKPMVEAALAQNAGAVDCLPPEWREEYRGNTG